jgi:quinol monooxygenase YgiN
MKNYFPLILKYYTMKTRLLLLSLGFAALMSACNKQKPVETPAVDTTAVTPAVTQKLITAKVFLKTEKVADFIAAAKAMVDSSNAEAGCISYQLYQNPYDQSQFIFVEVWKDQAAIDAHFAMPYFTAWGPKTQDWMAMPTELKIYDVAAQN